MHLPYLVLVLLSPLGYFFLFGHILLPTTRVSFKILFPQIGYVSLLVSFSCCFTRLFTKLCLLYPFTGPLTFYLALLTHLHSRATAGDPSWRLPFPCLTLLLRMEESVLSPKLLSLCLRLQLQVLEQPLPSGRYILGICQKNE